VAGVGVRPPRRCGWAPRSCCWRCSVPARTTTSCCSGSRPGHKQTWQIGGLIAARPRPGRGPRCRSTCCSTLPFKPGSSGYAQRLRRLLPGLSSSSSSPRCSGWRCCSPGPGTSRPLSFVEQPPTYTETLLGAAVPGLAERPFSTIWNFLAPDGAAVLASVLRSVVQVWALRAIGASQREDGIRSAQCDR